MPEQLTRQPELTLQVLRSAGCAEGARPDTLVKCPPARFCKLPGGEICVYGLPEAAQMTELTRADWRIVQAGLKDDRPPLQTVPLGTLLVAIVVSAAAGVLLAAVFAAARRRRRLRREWFGRHER